MKTMRSYIMASLLTVCGMAHAQQYQMEVEMRDGTIESYLMQTVLDVTHDDNNGTVVKLRGKGTYRQVVYQMADVISISWKEYKGGDMETTGQNTIQVDEQHLSVSSPDYSVDFDPTVIEEAKTLTVKKVSNLPPLYLGDGIEARNSIAYDFDLDGIHDLDGTVEIRLPIRVGSNELPFAAYYDKEKNNWVPVNHRYDPSTGELVIKTDHLSTYSGFSIQKSMSRAAKLSYLYLPTPPATLYELSSKLRELAYSDDPDAKALEMYGSEYSDVTQVGLDIGFNALQSLGFESLALSDFSNVLGHVGTILSVYQICRDDYTGNDAQLAGHTLKLCMSQAMGWASHYCGNAILTASMASIAMIDYTINKFATEAWTGRKDLYKKGFDLYYSRGGGGYRSATDWYRELKPIFWRKDLTEEQVNQLVDEIVTSYCRKFWQSDIMEEYFTKANDGVSWSYLGGLSDSLEDELSNELRGSLYNGILVSVIRSIKNKLELESFNLAEYEMEQYAKELNKICTLSFFDPDLKDNKSKYAGCIIRYKGIPSDIRDPQNWQCKLSNDGKGIIQTRVFAMVDAGVQGKLEIVTSENELLKEIKLEGLKSGYTTEENHNMIDISQGEELEQEDSFTIKMEPDFIPLPTPIFPFYYTSNTSEPEYAEVEIGPSPALGEPGAHYEDWYQDIVDAFRANRDFQPTISGIINGGVDGLHMNGTIDPETKVGSGTFTLKTSYHHVWHTIDDVKQFYDRFSGDVHLLANYLLDGDMEHEVQGTFTVRYIRDRYVYHFTGQGTYHLEGNHYVEVKNPGFLMNKYAIPGETEVITEPLVQDGKVTVEYKGN